MMGKDRRQPMGKLSQAYWNSLNQDIRFALRSLPVSPLKLN